MVDFCKGWEGSFDRKFGPDAPARKKTVQLIQALRGGDRKALLGARANGCGWVPTNADFDGKWTAPGFDDSKWKQGQNGAGFEAGKGFESLISKSFDFQARTVHAHDKNLHDDLRVAL